MKRMSSALHGAASVISFAVLCPLMPLFGENRDAGGLTFDFAAASEKRFASSFDASRNIVKGPLSGMATKSFTRSVRLPSTNGGPWRVSLRYRMRHSVPGGARLRITPGGPARSHYIPECGAEWGALSICADVPPGADSITASFVFSAASKVDFEYRDFTVVDETPESRVIIKEMPMGNIDGTFAVAVGRCGQLEYYWRKTDAVRYDWRCISFEVTLPPGIGYVDASFADRATVRTETRADGSSVTSFNARKGMVPPDKFNHNAALRIVVDAVGKPGLLGKGGLRMKYRDGGSVYESSSEDISILAVEPFEGLKPSRYCNGVMVGQLFDGLNDDASEKISRMMASAGVTWLVARGSQERYDMWRKLGVRRITPSARRFNNGFVIGNNVPKSDRFVPVNLDLKKAKADWVAGASCPVAVYSGSDFFRTNTVPYIRDFVKGSDGCWANWEPFMFSRKGCMCARCCRAFSAYLGRPYGEISAKWPKCVMEGGEYFETVLKFRSLEHAKVVKTIDRVVREVTGGESSLGIIPAVAWIEMGSQWRARNYAAEVQPIDYAGSLDWMNPWGPYAAWESDYPYVYAKRKPLCHFFAAQDVRKTVDGDYPPSCRPKLMALPQGFMLGHWLTQPEHISMALDSYFFNGWESTVLYYFPRGYDARYWNAFARATDRAARYERFVLDGRRSDGGVETEPFAGVYASPVRMITGYLPDHRELSPLQHVSYDLDGSRMIAAFNFWQKGEAFFTLRAKGLKPGRYEVVTEDGTVRVPSSDRGFYTEKFLAEQGVRVSVGAVRTKVFVIRPCDGTMPAKTLTDKEFESSFRERRAVLEREAAKDAEYERLNGDVVHDAMPAI